MTNKEAYEIIEEVKNKICSRKYVTEQSEAFDMALELLKQGPCSDAISRHDVWFKLTNGAYDGETTEQFIDRIAKEIESAPPVIPKQKDNKMAEKRTIMCRHCNDLNDINTAILNNYRGWEGLHTAEDIISITYNSNRDYYVVSWINRDYTVER